MQKAAKESKHTESKPVFKFKLLHVFFKCCKVFSDINDKFTDPLMVF